MEQGEYRYHASEGDRDWWQAGMRRATLAILPEGLSGKVLDCGAGAGYFVRDLRKMGLEAHGVEMGEIALAAAERLGHRSWLVQGKLQDHLPKDGSLALISCLDVLSHNAVNETEALSLMHASLAPAGYLLLRLPAYQWLYGAHDRYVHQHRRYGRQDVINLAKAHGFRLVRMSFANSLLFPLVVLNRLLEWLRERIGNGAPASSNHRLPGALNAIFKSCMTLEAKLIGAGVNLRFGSSLIVLLRRE